MKKTNPFLFYDLTYITFFNYFLLFLLKIVGYT